MLRPQGLIRHVIDYSDHYAHADANINEFNYLRFDERQWKKFNPGIHFQRSFEKERVISKFLAQAGLR